MSTFDAKQWEVLSHYLDDLLTLPEAERTGWLTSFRRQNPDLADVLQRLVEEQGELAREHFLEDGPVPADAEAALKGQTIGAYTLISQIGHGGMGSVWLAERSDGRFERQVAVKFLNFALGGSEAAERFKREGSILARLAHPHIANLHDAGVSSTGQPYLVLEYIAGAHIDSYCDEHTLEVEARIVLFLDVLAAVEHAHANLIVHRDIKPSNVLVRNDGEVKLLDFGIAKLLADEGGVGATALTGEGLGAMTPRFAAPEQLTGGVITTATDVYGLGVLLYLLLSGHHPAGPGPHSPAELVRAIVDTKPLSPSEVVAPAGTEMSGALAAKRATTSDRLRRQLRGDLDTIVEKALKKDPAERYASVAAFKEDLQRYLKHEPINARPDTIVYRAVKFVQRNRVAVTLAALAVFAIVAGLIGTLIQARTARRERDYALRQVGRAEAIYEFTEFLLTDAAPFGKPFTVKELLGRAEHILGRQRNTDDNRIELLSNIGLQYSIQEEDGKARQILEQAYKLSRGVSDPAVRAGAACHLVAALARDGEFGRAESLFQQGMKELPSGPQFALERVDCLRYGSEVAQESGNPKEGIARLEKAREVLQQSPFHSDWGDMVTLIDLGEAYRMADQNYKAITVFKRAASLASALGRDETQSAAVLCNDWALALASVGRPLEAEKLYHRAIDIHRVDQTEKTVPPVILNNYAKTLRVLGRLDQAADYAERAYAIGQQAGDQFAIYQSLYARALIYLDQRDFTRAAAALNELEPRLRSTFRPGDIWFGSLAAMQAVLAVGTGNSNRALQLSDQSVAIVEGAIKRTGTGTDYLPIVLIRRAVVELQAGRPAQAAVDTNRARTLLQANAPPGTLSSLIGDANLNLGKALQAEGKEEEARATFRTAAENFADALGADSPFARSAHELAAGGAGR